MRCTLLICLFATAPLFTGCGKEVHREAVALYQVLESNQPSYNSSNGMERDLVASTRGWTETIMTNGAGHGSELTQNAGVAKELARSADLISTRLGELRKALYDQEIKKRTCRRSAPQSTPRFRNARTSCGRFARCCKTRPHSSRDWARAGPIRAIPIRRGSTGSPRCCKVITLRKMR